MINYAALFRTLLLLGAALFLIATCAAVCRLAAEQRAQALEQVAQAGRRPHPTNCLPMQGGWGCRAVAQESSPAQVNILAPGASWEQ